MRVFIRKEERFVIVVDRPIPFELIVHSIDQGETVELVCDDLAFGGKVSSRAEQSHGKERMNQDC